MRLQFDKRFLTPTTWIAAAGVGLALAGCSGDLDGAGQPIMGGTGTLGSTTTAPPGVGPEADASLPSGVQPPGSVSAPPSTPGSQTTPPDGVGGASAGGGPGVPGGGGTAAGLAGQGGMPVDPAIFTATPVTKLRLLTAIEYKNSVGRLLEGAETATLLLPADNYVKSFTTVGGGLATVNEVAGENYEVASQALAKEVFSDPERWQALVGCNPQADLADACVETFLRTFGRRAFRRELTEEEASQWIDVARTAATLSEDPATGLATAISGILQSPNFLYRVEHAIPDLELGRIRFDGPSMATRLAFLFTGSTPEDWLLDAAAAGELDTAEGIRAAAEQLLAQGDSTAFMSEFFIELTELWQVLELERSAEQFPGVDDLRASMLEETRRFVRDVVLAPQADVRSFFDSQTTFVDSALAEFYGLQGQGAGFQQAEGFQEVQLGVETGRAGILGKAGFVFAHSSPDSTNPTKRGKFIVEQFQCISVPPVPADLMVQRPVAEEGEAVTTRQLFEEQHRVDATCVTCHSLMDPFGFALEHFDAIGRYRETENGLPINAATEFNGVPFDGAVELGAVLRDNAATTECFVENLYRYANGTPESETDEVLIEELVASLSEGGYVWRDLLVDFAASNAFTSLAPTPEAPPAVEE
jgi:hypothetical protein